MNTSFPSINFVLHRNTVSIDNAIKGYKYSVYLKNYYKKKIIDYLTIKNYDKSINVRDCYIIYNICYLIFRGT